MSRSHVFTLFVVVLAVIAVFDLHAQSRRTPKFREGDVDELAAKALRVRAIARRVSNSLIEVEVRNRSKWTVEPLTFEVTPGGAKSESPPLLIDRAPAPLWGRAGRSIPPRGVARYLLHSPFAADAGKPKVRVVSASFFRGKSFEDPPVKIVKRTRGKAQQFGRTIDTTTVTLQNLLRFPVHAVFEASYDSPYDGRALVATTIDGEAELSWTIEEMAGYSGAGIDGLKLVDWSVLVDDGEAPARKLLTEAWGRWHGWSAPDHAIAGRFLVKMSSRDGGGAVHETRGRFRVPAAGDIEVAFDGDVGPNRLLAHQGLLAQAFFAQRRPSEQRLKENYSVRMAAAEAVELTGEAWDRNQTQNVWVIEDSVVVGRRNPMNPRALYEIWHTQPMDGGWALFGVDSIQTALGKKPSTTQRWRHESIHGDILPVWFREVQMIGGDWWRTIEVELSELKAGDGPPIDTAPVGNGAAELAEAWQATYRYPREAVELTGRFEISHSGDGVWMGEREISGSFRLGGFRGMLMTQGRWDRATFEIDGKRTRQVEEAIVSAVEDRFRMWAFRDFAGRADFKRVFAGATITKEDEGRFVIKNGPFLEIALRDGLPAKQTLGSGQLRNIRFKKVAGHLVPQRIKTGTELLQATFRSVADGWLLPSKMKFSKVFGDDWEEELRLSGLVITRL